MATDKERRDVARRLRDNASQDWEWVVPWAIFNDAEEHDAPEIQQRLADLIEPGCDRVALLELASNMEHEANEMNAMGYNYDHQITYARCIREALGVEK